MKFPPKHLDRQIPPEAHTPMYVWHKYWSRKTWNVVGKYIETYCPKGGIVFDPFAGSGITAIEALRNGRRAIISDLVPIATEIARLTIKPVNDLLLFQAFKRVEYMVKDKIEKLYLTLCRKCHRPIVMDCALWNMDKCTEIRYQACPFCGDRQDTRCKPTQYDEDLLAKIEQGIITEWHPTNRLYYPDGTPFK